MAFRIGKVADLLGISPQGVRLYENSGIIKPRRGTDEQSSRVYEHMDFAALIRARGYHQTGFTTKQTASLLQAKNLKEVSSLYSQRQTELEEDLRFKTMLLENLRELGDIVSRADQELWHVNHRNQPGMYRFTFMKDGTYILDKGQDKILRQWISRAPLTFISQSNQWEKLSAGQIQYSAALGVWEKHAFELKLDLRWADYYPPRSALYSIVCEKGDEFHPLDSLRPLMDYIQKHRIQVIGDPVSRVFVSINKNENYTRYREVWIPIHD